MRYRKRIASTCENSSLGLTVTTPLALVEELWDVWGSCERIITSSQRSMLVARLLADQETWVASAGAVSLLSAFVRDHASALDRSFLDAHATQFTIADEEIVSFVHRYEEALAQVKAIEPARALERLASYVRLPRVIVRTRQELPFFWTRFLNASAQEWHVGPAQLLSDEQPSGRLVAQAECDHAADGREDARSFQLLKPAGQTASAYLIHQAILEQGERSVLVTAPDPQALFEHLAPSLATGGYTVALQATKSFQETLFGQAFDAVATLMTADQVTSYDALLAAALTYVDSPYAQLPSAQAQRLARALRDDRTLAAFDMRNALAASSRTFEFFEELLVESDAEILFAYFEDMLPRLGLSSEIVACERAIIASLKTLYRDARTLEMRPAGFFELARASSAPFARVLANAQNDADDAASSRSSGPFLGSGEGAQVLFTTFDAAAAFPQQCCDAVIMTSLDADHYRGAQQRSTLSVFLDRFDLPSDQDATAAMEANFAAVMALARSSVIFEYAQQGINGDERYPAFFLEAFLNDRALAEAPIDEVTIGEDSFDLTARFAEPSPDAIATMPLVQRGHLSTDLRTRLLPRMRDAQGVEHIVISPSALELYRKCPYRWFVERKLRLEDGGEAFGNLEIGSFMHGVFQAFYEAWAAQGHARVTPDTLEAARALMEAVFDEQVAAQMDGELGKRLVAVSESERKELDRLRAQALESLGFQQHLFGGYRIEGHEVEIALEDAILYGGAFVKGRIDRIDIDDAGDFIIVDYKGSIAGHAAGYELGSEDESFSAPEKVQALIYAQAYARKHPDRTPKAAVYLSYRATRAKDVLAGSLSETLPECESFTTKSSVVEGNLSAYLDLMEADLAKTVERMSSGDIAPDPRTARACEHCPVLYCEKRADGSH